MTIGRSTENTDRDLLIEILRKELLDYDIIHDVSFTYFDIKKKKEHLEFLIF